MKTIPVTEELVKSNVKAHERRMVAHYLFGTAQSVGRQREHNEDTLFALNSVLREGTTEFPFGIFIVADGMGGHQHGEIASGAAIRAISSYLISELVSPIIAGEISSLDTSLQELMEKGIETAQEAVISTAPGGGTTLTAALIIGDQVTIGHVGDSRAYFATPDGEMEAITKDHSLVKRLLELGQISEKEASVHPQRNVLYRAVGQTEPYRPDIETLTFPAPGSLLICSDGLWGVVGKTNLQKILRKAGSPMEICQKMVDAANQAGGPDNITVVLVQNFD
ncbi:MAG TPA: protein phosphatase 2C domain-containing protein [Leptolinea sp.]